jgi:flavodoxin I
MKVLIVYDSFFGNTEKVARAMADVLAVAHQVKMARVGDVKPDQLEGLDVLIVGSPTRAFRPSPAIGKFLASIPDGALEGVRTGSFDTRISEGDVNLIVRTMMKLFGYAAKPISDQLAKKGGKSTGDPEGFIVTGKEGPLREGELQRATDWAQRIAAG